MNSHDEIPPTDFDDVNTQDQEDVVEGWSAPAAPNAETDRAPGVAE